MQRRIHRLTVFGLIALMAIAILSQPAWAGKKDDTLNIATTKELESVDRYFNTAREGIIFARHVYDNLLYRDPKTYEYKGLLAKSFKWVDDTTMAIELLCKKLGMTQVFADSGEAVPVTVLEAGPNVVVQKKTDDKDGYSAIQVGFQDRKAGRTSKAQGRE